MTSFVKKTKTRGCIASRAQVDTLEARFETLANGRKIPSSHSHSVKEGIVTEPDTGSPAPLAERRERVHVSLDVLFLCSLSRSCTVWMRLAGADHRLGGVQPGKSKTGHTMRLPHA